MDIDLSLMAFLTGWGAATVRLAGPLLMAALGELYAERAGVLNIGLEGTMLLGAFAAWFTAWMSGSVWLGMTAGIAAGLMAGGVLAFLYVSARASQVVAGILFNMFALGLASYLYRIALDGADGAQTVPMFADLPVPVLSAIPLLGPVLFHHSLPLYLTVVLVAVAAMVLYRTGFGLNLRAVGENPRAADTAGINVSLYRYVGVLIAGGMGGLAGGYLVLAQVGQFRETIVSGQGFIALAIVIFGRWDPLRAAGAALVFGAADALQLSLQMFGTGVPPQVLLALPYVLTILAMSGITGRAHQPEAFMQPYRRE
ncbi:MAG TPA: ABC transporter permease [Paenirhodobacter sp.]